MMVLVYSFKRPATAELIGNKITYWEMGYKVFEGTLDEFAVKFPEQMQELITSNVVKEN